MSDTRARRPGLLVGVAMALTAAATAIVLWRPFRLGADDWAWPRVKEPALGSVGSPLVVYALVLAIVVVAWRRVAGRFGEALLVALLVGVAFVAQLRVGQQSPGGYQEGILALTQAGPNRYHEAARDIERRGKRLAPVVADYVPWMRDKAHRLIITHPAGPLAFFWTLNHVFAGDQAAALRFVRWCEDRLGSGVRLSAYVSLEKDGREKLPGPELDEGGWAARLVAPLSAAELAGAWLATLVLQLVASLVVVPVYLMARQLCGRRSGVVAGAFAAATPSLLLFSPGLDQCYPAVVATACWLSYTAGEARNGVRAALAGLLVSAGLFFSLVFAVAAAWSILLGIVGLCRGEPSVSGRRAAWLFALAAVGFLVPVGLLYAVLRYNSLAVWWACWEANAQFNAQCGRVYWKWVLINPVDFLVFLGVPVACLFVRRVASEVRELGRRRVAARDWATVVVAGLLVTLNVLGGSRGEVARLWMFLMPACAVAAAAELENYSPYRRAVFAVLFALQCVQVVWFKGCLDVLHGLYRDLGS
jgi:hypothetical protein